MGHHAQDIVTRAVDPCNPTNGPVGICARGNLSSLGAVTKGDAVVALQLSQRSRLAKIVSLHVPDGNFQNLALLEPLGERVGGSFSTHKDLFADVAQAGIPQQRSGKHTALAENLKAVADAENQAARSGKPFYRLHYR